MDSTFVEILKNLTVDTIDMVKTSSPVVWEMVRQRVLVTATVWSWVGGIITVIGFIFISLSIFLGIRDGDDDGEGLFFFSFCVFVIFGIIAIINMINLYTIDYVTATKILRMIKP